MSNQKTDMDAVDELNLSSGTKRKINEANVSDASSCGTTSGKSLWSADRDDNSNHDVSTSSKSQYSDLRKRNKGCSHRKSYSMEFKRRAISMRDSGLRIEAIAKTLDIAKSNVEKWCSAKVSQHIFIKQTKLILFLFLINILLLYSHVKRFYQMQ